MNRVNCAILYALLILFCACTQEDANVEMQIKVQDVQRNSATIIGKVTETEDGETTVYNDCGIYWSETNPVPTAADGIIMAKQMENGDFLISMTQLKGATTYYVKGYAKSYSKTLESQVLSFTTPGGSPQFSAGVYFPGEFRINITDLGGKEIKEAGVCGVVAREVPIDFMPDIQNSIRKPQTFRWIDSKHTAFTMSIPFAGNAPNSFSKEIFYIRAYIITENGIGYSKRFEYRDFSR